MDYPVHACIDFAYSAKSGVAKERRSRTDMVFGHELPSVFIILTDVCTCTRLMR